MRQSLQRVLFLVVGLVGSLVLFAAGAGTTPVIKTGTWRGVLHRPDGEEIVFNFTTAKEKGKIVLYVQNADERLLVDSIKQQGDSLWIQMPFFASRFAVAIEQDGNWKGSYVKNYGSRSMIVPFTAVYGNKNRYPLQAKPLHNITGKWAVQFEGEDTLLSKAIGEFAQDANGRVTGTFRTPTGDYRYLEGTVSSDSLQLSAFDGGHAVVFTAKLDNDSTMSHAILYSGLTSKETWTAVKNENAELPDSYDLTKMRPGETNLTFSFTSTDGKHVSINDAAYKGKVVIVQILGSWCPNCMDETSFLSQYYKENKQRGVEVIGLAYERTEDYAEAKESLQPFRKRFAVQYPFLITGVTVSDEKRTEKTLPQIEQIKAFPTTLFIDKKGNVDEIHTGYDGPATGEHYEAFKKEFNAEVDKLLQE